MMQRQLDDAFRFSLRGGYDTDVTSVLIYFVLISLDIDECSADPDSCDQNADCSNSKGSYSCTCRIGFTGDGKTCQGIFVANITYVCGGLGIVIGNVKL